MEQLPPGPKQPPATCIACGADRGGGQDVPQVRQSDPESSGAAPPPESRVSVRRGELGSFQTCRNVGRGHQYCIGGDTAAYDSCVAKFNAWGDSSRAQIAEKVKQSTATWKIVNSHYSAYNHYVEYNMKKWFDILRGSGVHVWLNGHTHGEKHDYSSSLGIHFFENGAGGGIQKESASGIPAYAAPYVKNLWTYGSNEYGFMSLQASKNWIKMQYHTADSNWQFGQNFQSTKVGGVQTKHCWYIPADGTQGRSC
ncbi:hypothetical protein ON010_g8325 [Phytophthora cinnamomi]|nr:hypothetical protein ON010_g8325 [Phytophthora cinnamomi]